MAPEPSLAPRWIRAIAVCTAISLAGCSFTMSGPPAYTPPQVFPSCNEDILLPTLDLSMAVLHTLFGGAVVADSNGDDGATAAAVIAAVGIAIFGGAAYSGFSKARRCGEVRDEYRARYQLYLQQQPQFPPPPPPAGPFGPPSAVPRGPS